MKEKAIPLPKTPSRVKFSKKSIFVEVITALLLITWLHAGVSKLIGHVGFKMQLFQSPIFQKYSSLVSYAGPILEIFIAVLLIFQRTRRLGLLASFFLMAFFSWYVAYLMIKLPALPCSCGGVFSFLDWPQHLIVNIALAILAIIGFFLQKKIERKTKEQLPN